MDNTDLKLLALLQNGFPLTSEPFVDLGKILALSGDEVIQHIQKLKDDGVIREISPVIDARSLGYLTTLVAMRVPEDSMEQCSSVLNENSHVSHAYVREHSLNIWFTLAVPGTIVIKEELSRIADAIPADTIFHLPPLKLYKIGAFFGAESTCQPAGGKLSEVAKLSSEDRTVVNELQQDIPLITRPFTGMARNADIDEKQFLERCRSLLERGIIRRYGAAVNHRRAGYTANAMACWNVPREETDKAGQHLASLRDVSHCYERKTNTVWRYNLFAMIHGKARETCQEIAGNVSKDCAMEDFRILFSTRELKKKRLRYLV